jgi:hypothetical protein
MAIRLLKHHLSDFVKVAFYDALNTENDFKWPFNAMKHRFIVFYKVVFYDVWNADYGYSGQSA